MEKIISSAKLSDENNCEIVFEVVKPNVEYTNHDEYHKYIESQINGINSEMVDIEESIYALDKRLDKYTNHADKLDYSIAVASGILCGVIDSLYVGEFSFSEGLNFSKEKLKKKIIELAKEKGWEGIKRGKEKGKFTLQGAIKFLEDKFKMPSDPLMNIFGGSRQHHLRDFAHHHSPIGLFFSILSQFTGKTYGTDTAGNFIVADLPEKMIGRDLEKKWAIAVTDWVLHLASDIHGSSSTPGEGCGIPGPIVSLIKAISALPIFKEEKVGDNKISLFAAKLYNGTLFADRDENGKIIGKPVQIDLRGEMAIKHELGKQAVPVIANDVIVRSFYLIRRLYSEIKTKEIHSWKELHRIEWEKVIPVNNATINRMLVIATGTFTAVDLADASLRASIFGLNVKELVLRINYIGVVRFGIALGVEYHMSNKRERLRTERIWLTNQMLIASNAKVFYKQADMWVSAQNAQQAISELFETSEKIAPYILTNFCAISGDLNLISSYVLEIEKKNPDLLNELINELK